MRNHTEQITSTFKRLTQLVVWTLILVLLTSNRIQAESSVTRIAQWNPQQDIIAVTDGYTIKLYDSSFDLINQLVVVSDPNLDIEARGMEWSPDGNKLALVLYGVAFDLTGNVVQIWDMTNLQLLTQIPNISFQPGVAWSPDSAQIAVVHSYGNAQEVVRVYSVQNGASLSEFPSSAELRNITRLAWDSNGGQIAGSQIAFEEDAYVQIWDATTQQYITTLPIRIDNEIGLAYSPADNRLAFVDLENPTDILIWDSTTFQLVRTLQGHTERIYTFTWGSGGIISVSFDDTTRVWDPDTGATEAVIPSGVTFTPSWNPNGTLFVTTDDTVGVYIRDAVTGDIVAVLGGSASCTSTIEAGDASGLISAIEAANANPDADTLCLAAGSTYTLTAAHNTQSGANGLPPITTDITLIGNGATITRDATAPPFRLLLVTATGALTLEDVTLAGGYAGVADPGDNGGAVYNLGTLTLIDSAITSSSANGDGGGIYNAGTLTLSEASQIESNFAADDGGGIYSTAGTVIVTDSAIANNTAGDQGGGIRSVTCSVTLTNASLTGNNASSASGGGLYGTSTALAIHGGTISGNVANTGAGLYLTNSPSPAQLDGGLQIVDNAATTSGGALYLSEDGQAALTNVRVAGNQASSSSAGIRMGGTLTITDSEISDNGSATQPGSGGGIRASGALTIINSTLTGNQVNSSSGLGAGIYVADGGIVSVIGGEVSDNHAYRGGGFYVTGSLGLSTTVSENSATSHGGGLYVSTGAASVDYCTFAGNTASITGGGIYNNATLQAANTLFSGNSANDRAGAIYAGSVVDSWVHSSCIEGNTSPNTGGVYSGPTGFDATNNWWGATDGPSGAGSGSGDAVNNKVTFTPFLTTACPAEAGAGAAQGIMSLRALAPLSATRQVPEPVRLPIETAFADESGWWATGTWLLDTLVGHDSAPSWAVNTVPRDQESTLELLAPVALGRARSPRLTFWQRGQIATSDRVIVEILPQGETTWIAVDHQTSLPADWTQHTVDLSTYQGQMVRLRLRVVAGGELSAGDRTLGLWIDDLSITSG